MFKIPGVDIGAGPKEIQLNPFKWFGGGGGGGKCNPPTGIGGGGGSGVVIIRYRYQ